MSRYALFLTPLPGDPLDAAAARWLGRDVYADSEAPHPKLDGLATGEIADLTQDARRYGFHGTMKAPFRLAVGFGETDLVSAFNEYRLTPPTLPGPQLRVGNLDGFFALVPDGPAPGIDALARDLVEHFDRFRAPLTQDEISRRRPDRLSAAEVRHLHRWGYPYVMESFRYHMTLTRRVPDADHERVARAVDAWFGRLVAGPLHGLAVALFVERAAGAPFTALAWRRLRLTDVAESALT